MNNDNYALKYRLGIDIGGTNTVLGLVDPDGNISERKTIPTCGHPELEDYLRSIGHAFREMKTYLPEGSIISGCGVGAPCANQSTGCIEGATNMPWKGVIPIARLLEEELGIPTTLGNDANVAAAGEWMFGAAKGLDNFIMLTLGTGVGGAIVADGHLLVGSRGFAAELGHVTLGEGYDRECPCGRRGCLQTYCQAEGVVKTAIELLEQSDTPSELREVSLDDLSAKVIAEAANEGDALAIETYRITGEILGEATANFLAVTDPDAVILFGGVSKAGELITKPMKEAMERKALFLYKDRVRILTSQHFGAEAAILGAAALAEAL